VRINAATRKIEKTIRFGLDENPTELQINGTGDTLYFLNKNIYRHMVLSDRPPELFIESPYTSTLTGGFYGLGVDPFSGEIYLADAIDQVQQGVVYRYKPDGTVVDTFKTGINPSFFCFRPVE
jgi:hypothetical protein